MNLETEAAPIESRLNGLIIGETQVDAHPFVVSRVVRTASPDDQRIADLVFHDIIEELQGQPWHIPELSNPEISDSFSSLQYLGVNFNGSLRETIQNHIRFAVFSTTYMQGTPLNECTVQIKELPAWIDPMTVTVAADGTVLTGRFEFSYGEHYKETCSTCQNGKRLLQFEIDRLRGGLMLGGFVEGMGYPYGDSFVKPHKNMMFHLAEMNNGATIHERFRNWFIETNAGAIEMANIINVSFVGI